MGKTGGGFGEGFERALQTVVRSCTYPVCLTELKADQIGEMKDMRSPEKIPDTLSQNPANVYSAWYLKGLLLPPSGWLRRDNLRLIGVSARNLLFLCPKAQPNKPCLMISPIPPQKPAFNTPLLASSFCEPLIILSPRTL